MKVLVSGGRDYADRQAVFDVLDWFNRDFPITLLIHGHCPSGADKLADDWCHFRHINVKRYPADWDNVKHPNARVRFNRYGKEYDANAGFRRNSQMLHSGPDAAIVFPGGNGTSDMLTKLRKTEIYRWVINPKKVGMIECEGSLPNTLFD